VCKKNDLGIRSNSDCRSPNCCD